MALKVAIAGVGNCAAVFIQGLSYYRGKETRGLWHPKVGGLRPSDIEVVAAFDIDQRKVGLDLSAAAFAQPNVPRKYAHLPKSGIGVSPGISTGDLPPHLRGSRTKKSTPSQVAHVLKSSKAQLLVNLVSSGSDEASGEYARAALQAGCGFVNCTPTLLLKDRSLRTAFAKSNLPLVGDDLMSQFGGTAFHKGLLGLMVRRGVKVSKSYQLDVGGGSETLNTIDEQIKMAKRAVKTSSVASEVPYKFETIAGTTDYVDYMGNDRTSYFWFDGSGFAGSGITVDVYLRSSDGANAGNILLDVLRATYLSMRERNPKGIEVVCAYGFKAAPTPMKFDEASARFEAQFVK